MRIRRIRIYSYSYSYSYSYLLSDEPRVKDGVGELGHVVHAVGAPHNDHQ
jgi:hypothetical protein